MNIGRRQIRKLIIESLNEENFEQKMAAAKKTKVSKNSGGIIPVSPKTHNGVSHHLYVYLSGLGKAAKRIELILNGETKDGTAMIKPKAELKKEVDRLHFLVEVIQKKLKALKLLD